jgi:hypothetical protein
MYVRENFVNNFVIFGNWQQLQQDKQEKINQILG